MTATQSLTRYEFLSLIISIAGFLSVLVTLFILVRQTKAMTDQSKYLANALASSVYQTVTNTSFALDTMFMEHPELRPYFFDGKEIDEKDSNYEIVSAAAEFHLDYFISLLVQIKYFPERFGAVQAYILDEFAQSPMLCRYLEKRKAWYSDELVMLMKKGATKHS